MTELNSQPVMSQIEANFLPLTVFQMRVPKLFFPGNAVGFGYYPAEVVASLVGVENPNVGKREATVEVDRYSSLDNL